MKSINKHMWLVLDKESKTPGGRYENYTKTLNKERSQVIQKYWDSSQNDSSVEVYWNVCWRLLEYPEKNFARGYDRSCGRTESSARHRKTWWQNNVSNSFISS